MDEIDRLLAEIDAAQLALKQHRDQVIRISRGNELHDPPTTPFTDETWREEHRQLRARADAAEVAFEVAMARG